MIVNGASLLTSNPIKDMLTTKVKLNGVSHGLAEAGYDIRIKQDISFFANTRDGPMIVVGDNLDSVKRDMYSYGRFTLASTIEEFTMPPDLVGVVHDKSTWARKGLSVFNTVIEPNWNGFLTLELVFHGNEKVHIPAGSGIAQVLFTRIENKAYYDGKYQNQENNPVEAIMEK